MLRIPNPISDLNEIIQIYKDIFPLLKNYKDFDLDTVSEALIKTNNVTSQGAIGLEALKRSTRSDRSLDPIYNQSKALCELYRLLGWMQSTTAQTKYIVTQLGELLLKCENVEAFVDECLINIVYPNECVQVKSASNLRPFMTMLYYLNKNNYITRDEIIYGVLNLDTDTDKNYIEKIAKAIEKFRSIKGKLQQTLIEIGKEQGIKYNPTMGNYTRFPIAAMKSANIVKSDNNKLYLTDKGREIYEEFSDYKDFRLEDFNALSEQEKIDIITFAHLNVQKRYNLDYNKEIYAEVKKRLKKANVIDSDRILFSPFQVLSYTTISSYTPELIYEGANEYKKSELSITGTKQEAVYKKLQYEIESKVLLNINVESFEITKQIKNCLTNSDEDKTVAYLSDYYKKANKEIFYPLVAHLFCILGFNCKVSRGGQNYERADAIIIDAKFSIPIEIKSPCEETEISVKAVRQALENKIIFLSRKSYTTDNMTTSLAVGYNPPNKRSDVFELISDIKKVFNFNIGVLSFKDLLTLAVKVIKTNKLINIENFKNLCGVYNV